MRNDELKNLRDEIRSWTDRPPERTPGQARTRVLARIDGPRTGDRSRRHRWGLAVATAALAAGLALGLLFLQPAPPAGPPVAKVEPEAPPPTSPPASQLLLYELRSGTKLYLDLGSRRAPEAAPPPPT